MKIIKKLKNKLSNIKFKKNNSLIKKRLYITDNFDFKYRSKRKDSFKLFTKKLQFDNAFNKINNLHFYYSIIWVFLFLSVVYVLFFSHYFVLKNIDVIRNDEFINIDMVYNWVDDFRYLSILSIDKELLKSRILSYQPHIKDIQIIKILPDSLKINLKSYPVFYETKIYWNEYFITDNWVFLPKNLKLNKTKLQIFWIDEDIFLQYKKIIKKDDLKKITYTINKLKETNTFIKEKEFKYYKKEREFHILLESWEILIFDLFSEDILTQIQKLNVFYKKYTKTIKNWIYYIDLRIKDKIFFCSKKEEKQCKKNLEYIYKK